MSLMHQSDLAKLRSKWVDLISQLDENEEDFMLLNDKNYYEVVHLLNISIGYYSLIDPIQGGYPASRGFICTAQPMSSLLISGRSRLRLMPQDEPRV